MGFFTRNKEKTYSRTSILPEQSASQSAGLPVEGYDAYGSIVVKNQSDWLQSVFPGLLEKNWDAPSALYQSIVQAVQDGFFEEIRPAAEHCKDIDTANEKVYAILADIYMKTNDLEKAGILLNEYIASYGKTGTVLTHLSEVYAAQGNKDASHDTLLEGLQIDPNQEDGLARWISNECSDHGKEYYVTSIKEACRIENSWAPQLYLAQYFVKQKEIDEAVTLYRQVMPFCDNNPLIMLQIATDLSANEYFQECLDIVGPVYDCRKQDIRTGLHLLQIYLITGDYNHGQKLLTEMMQLNREDLKAHLIRVNSNFEKIKTGQLNYLKETEKTLRFTMLTLDRPIWQYELLSPDWLLPEKKRSTKVGIMSYADISLHTVDSRIVQREDDVGRLTRSIPLILLETLSYFSDHEPIAVISVAIGVGPTVSKKEVEEKYLKEAAEKSNLDYVIAGSISLNDAGYANRTQIYSRAKQKVSIVRMNTTIEEFGQSCISMISDIHAGVDSPIMRETEQRNTLHPEQSNTLYQLPKPEQIPEYLSALAQLFTQSLIANDGASTDSLWEEKGMLNGYLNLALADPKNQMFRVILVSGMAKSKLYHSEEYKEFKEPAISLLSGTSESNVTRENNGTSESIDSSLLLPFVYRMFDMQYELYLDKKRLLSTVKNKRYVKWLKQIS